MLIRAKGIYPEISILKTNISSFIKNKDLKLTKYWGTWVAQSVKCLP